MGETGLMTNKGKQQEWLQWIREKGPRFLLFARQQTRSEADAQDVFQDAIVKLWKRQSAGKEDPSFRPLPPDAQVFVAVRQCAIDMARRDDRRSWRETQAIEWASDASVAWFAGASDTTERHERLHASLQTLETKYREVLTLKIWGQLTYAQIAEILSIPANTAASRYRYGLQALRRKMKASLV